MSEPIPPWLIPSLGGKVVWGATKLEPSAISYLATCDSIAQAEALVCHLIAKNAKRVRDERVARN